METVLLFACILVAVALAGDNLLGVLCICAACQFLCVVVWVIATSTPRGDYQEGWKSNRPLKNL